MGHGDRLPPGKAADDFCTIMRSGMWRLKWALSAEGKKRLFDEFIPLLHDSKHEVLQEEDNNSWYLVYIGTKVESRGHGFARALAEDIKNQVSQIKKLGIAYRHSIL